MRTRTSGRSDLISSGHGMNSKASGAPALVGANVGRGWSCLGAGEARMVVQGEDGKHRPRPFLIRAVFSTFPPFSFSFLSPLPFQTPFLLLSLVCLAPHDIYIQHT